MSATRGTGPTQGTPTGGQCSRESPQAAGTSLPDQPSRATTRLTVFSGPVTAIGEAQVKTWLIEWDRSLKTKANYHGLIYGVFAGAVRIAP